MGAEIGIVLGTSKKLSNGEPNPFFDHRIEAAATLIRSGKVEKLLLSGSKDSIYYNEPNYMKSALLTRGVKESQIVLDPNGDRTLQSLARLRDIYGFDQCIVVTQKYHAYRTLFLADHLGIDSSCFVADSPNFGSHFEAILREIFARSKAVLDVYVLES